MLDDCGTIWFDRSKYVEAETRYYLWLQKKNYGIEVEVSPACDLLSVLLLAAYCLLCA